MSNLWLGVATLTALALALVVVPFWRMSKAQNGRRNWPLSALLSVLLVAAVGGYALTGYWQDVTVKTLLDQGQVRHRPPAERQLIVSYLGDALRQQPDNVMIIVQLGLELQAAGNLPYALALFKAALNKKEAIQALGIEQDIARLVEGLEHLKSETEQQAKKAPPASQTPTDP